MDAVVNVIPIVGYVPIVTGVNPPFTYVAGQTFFADVQGNPEPGETGAGWLIVDVIDQSAIPPAHAPWVVDAIAIRIPPGGNPVPAQRVNFVESKTPPILGHSYVVVASCVMDANGSNGLSSSMPISVSIPGQKKNL